MEVQIWVLLHELETRIELDGPCFFTTIDEVSTCLVLRVWSVFFSFFQFLYLLWYSLRIYFL